MDSLENAKRGVLNNLQLSFLISDGFVLKSPFHETGIRSSNGFSGIDGSSLDLHVSNEAWEIKSTAKLNNKESVNDLLQGSGVKKVDISSQALQKDHIYLIKLKEELAFDKFQGKDGLYGRASGKSSIGRLDILTRLIVDYMPKYDEIPPEYHGHLYVEVVPLSFDVWLEEGISLNQLRVFLGNPALSRLAEHELSRISPMLYYRRGEPVSSSQEVLRANLKPDTTIKTETNIVSFKAIEKPQLEVDLRKKNHNPRNYWEPEFLQTGSLGLEMKKDQFYILRSLERMFLPNDIAVTCVAYSENLGELRIHYAGFAHPNFGRKRADGMIGAPLIFEARCHSFNVTIRDEEQFARIEYYHMSEPTEISSGYSEQELKLSNYFEDWS